MNANPFEPYMDVVFLVYGAVFLALGLTIVIRNDRHSELEVSQVLWLLAAFSFIHGLLEWTEVWRIVRGDPPWLTAARPAIMLVSYLFLFEFGRRLLAAGVAPATLARARLLTPWVYAVLLPAILLVAATANDLVAAVNIAGRYLVGFPGACLAGAGCYYYCRNRLTPAISVSELTALHIACDVAGVSFVAYGVLGGLVVPQAQWFPASVINQENFLATFHVPVQLARAACAGLVAISIGILLRVFRVEAQQRLNLALLEAQQALSRLQKIADRVPGVVFQFRRRADGSTCVPYASDALADIYRVKPEDVRDNAAAVFAAVHADDLPAHLDSIEASARDLTPWHQEYRLKFAGESDVWISANALPQREADGSTLWHGFLSDVTERKHAEEALLVAATAFECQEGMVVTDARGTILRVNRTFIEITGYSYEDAVGQTMSLLRSGRHDQDFYGNMWECIRRTGSWQGEIWNRRKNGEVYPEWLTVTAVKGDDEDVTHYVGTLTDITLRKAAEDEIKHLAFYDPLTRLPNRRLLLDRLKHALAACGRTRGVGALLFIDLDNFKTLNDTRGHDVGDLLLQGVAERLVACVREGDTVARLGGDEFVVMLEHLSANAEEAATQTKIVGEKIRVALVQTYLLAGDAHHTTPSIGATLFDHHHDSTDELLKRADLAMYRAKAGGRNALCFFDPEMQATVSARATLEADLRLGLEHKSFILYYQAQVDGHGYITGAEALVRWQHPQRGLVAPAEFIPLAEETGLIVPLGHWVLVTACRQLAAWAAIPQMAHLTVAVNVSARQLHNSGFVDQLLAVLDETGADPHKLKLELTESLLLEDVEDVIEKMTVLKAKGVSFALDDFGTGYSSLSYLKRLPLDQLKIDRSFVRHILTDANDAAIARTIVALAESMGVDVIAEGVETEEQRQVLAGLYCYASQGYLFGRPLAVEDFSRCLLGVPTAACAC